jgi:uncharacterized membrane protein
MKKYLTKKNILYLFIIFLIGGLIGWFYELIFYYLTEGRITNRGVLFGPILPIYGLGAIGIYALKPLKKTPILLFLACILVTGLVEYIIGYISFNIFDTKLWDYTGLFLNINGIVCLRSVISFAIGGLIFHYILEENLYKLYNKFNFLIITRLCYILMFFLVLDSIISYFYRTPITY